MSNPRQIVLNSDRNPNDVLCGRGKPFYEYSGNVRFRELIYERLEEYHACKSLKVKNRIARDVLDCIRSQSDPPGRFLSLEAGSADRPEKWRLADERTVMEKAKQAFRSQKKDAIKGWELTEGTAGEVASTPSSLGPTLDVGSKSPSDGQASKEEKGPFAGVRGLSDEAHHHASATRVQNASISAADSPPPMFLPLDAVGAKSPSDGHCSTEEMGPFAGLQGLKNDAHLRTVSPSNRYVTDKAGHQQEDQNKALSLDVFEPTPLPSFDGSAAQDTAIPPTPVFSFSAADLDLPAAGLPNIAPTSASDLPVWTPEDERVELASLTLKEMTLADKDLHGTIDGMGNLSVSGKGEGDYYQHASAADIIRLEAELEALPSTEKAAYLQARQKCPHLLTQDHKASFLERENLDALQAARRMALYWDIRYKTFGPELCYLPMTLVGAMKNDAEGMVKHCALCILPVTDLRGRAIFFSDTSRRDYERFSQEREARVIFYLLHTLAANPASRRAGFVLLVNARHASRQNAPFKSGYYLHNLVKNALSITARSVHAINPSPFVYYAYPIIKTFIGREGRLRFKVHYGNEDKVLADLEGYGLPRDRLPREVGGELVLNFAHLVAGLGVKEAMAVLDENEVKDWGEREDEMPRKRRKAATELLDLRTFASSK